MLKKNYRQIRLLRIESVYQARGRQGITARPNMRRRLLQLAGIVNENGPLITTYRSEKICIGLRRMIIDEEKDVAVLLWAAGDRDLVDPSFWDADKDVARTEEAKAGERVSYSCHMVINLKPTAPGVLVAAKEEVPTIGVGLIEKTLNAFLRKHIKVSMRDPDDESDRFTAYPTTTIDTLASRTMRQALLGKKPISIEATISTPHSGKFDERFERKKDARQTLWIPDRNWTLDQFIPNLQRLLSSKPEYEDVYIRYKERKATGTLHFECSEIEDNDLETYLFAQRIGFEVRPAIGQFCRELHTRLSKKMSAAVVAEHARITRANRRDD